MVKSNAKTFFLSPATLEEVLNELNTFNLIKANGPNSIPVKILKDMKSEISVPLSTITNLSFNIGIFPSCLKLAKVINDLNGAVTHSNVHHFVDDTNMLYISTSLKDTNRKVNNDLRYIVEWLRANKISLNSGKTELIIFRFKNKNITKKMNFRISGQNINILCILD